MTNMNAGKTALFYLTNESARCLFADLLDGTISPTDVTHHNMRLLFKRVLIFPYNIMVLTVESEHNDRRLTSDDVDPKSENYILDLYS